MIIISMTTADPLGQVALKEGDSELSQIEARVSRQATLDGGCVITHSGVSHGDRTFRIKTKINAYQKAAIEHINANSVLVNISCSEGLFLGAISYLDTSTSKITMTILIKNKEA